MREYKLKFKPKQDNCRACHWEPVCRGESDCFEGTLEIPETWEELVKLFKQKIEDFRITLYKDNTHSLEDERICINGFSFYKEGGNIWYQDRLVASSKKPDAMWFWIRALLVGDRFVL